MDVQIAFGAPTSGWIRLELRREDVHFSDVFSHVYPALRDLCSALCSVLNGVSPRAVIFLLEPAELELTFVLDAAGLISLCARLFPDSHREREGTRILEHIATARELVPVFWRALRRLQTSLPEEDFVRRFGEPFPALEMTSLSRLLEIHKKRWAELETRAG
jgi:hypothetical protein